MGRSVTGCSCPSGVAVGDLGKTTEFSRQTDPAARASIREKRFKLQRLVWRLLPAATRLTACHVIAGKGAGGHKLMPEIRLRPREGGGHTAHYGGVARCGAVWVCPVCAPAIAATRTAEIMKAREAWEADGGAVVLVTFTTRHNLASDLAATVKGLRLAREGFRKHRRVREYVEALGFVGKVAALEVTHGDRNGWHPHLHELWFIRGGGQSDQVQKTLAGLWADACERHGLMRPTRSVGLHVMRLREGADGYIVQGADVSATIGHELTAVQTKGGRQGNRSLWELLLAADRGSRRAADLWVQAAEVLHGKAALFWSAGLKARFGIHAQDDKQIVDARDHEGQRLIPVRSWYLVTRYRARASLLQAAEYGAEYAEALICELERRADRELVSYLREFRPALPS